MINEAYMHQNGWLSTENSQMAAISYVNVPYTSIPDSSVKVSDADINEFVKL